jgi:hypothetical protein
VVGEISEMTNGDTREEQTRNGQGGAHKRDTRVVVLRSPRFWRVVRWIRQASVSISHQQRPILVVVAAVVGVATLLAALYFVPKWTVPSTGLTVKERVEREDSKDDLLLKLLGGLGAVVNP